MNVSSNQKRFTAAILAALAVSAGANLPAQAQWGNLPYMAQNSLLYPLSRLFGYPYNYNLANPYYLTNFAVNRAAINSGYFRAPGYGQLPVGVQDYSDDEPLNTPRQRVRPYRVGQFGVDQNVSASWGNGQDPNAPADQTPGAMTSGPASTIAQTGLLMPASPPRVPYASAQTSPAYTGRTLPPQPTVSTTMPPVAPTRHGKHSKQSKNSQYQTPQASPLNAVPQQASPAPLAAGFVDLVNAKYDGDLGKALFNPDARAWARTVGLIQNDQMFGADLSSTRVSLMQGIMKDPNLDAVSKLDAVKILLRGQGGTPVTGSK
jgi:hypothetical protein